MKSTATAAFAEDNGTTPIPAEQPQESKSPIPFAEPAATIREAVPQIDLDRKYVYRLLGANMEREAPVYEIEKGRQYLFKGSKFKPFQNLLMLSSIVWDGKKEKPWGWGDHQPGRRRIRYYDGCTTLYVDLHPRDKETYDGLILSTRPRYFNNGELEVMGYDNMLKLYIDYCSYNRHSPYRVPQVDVIFEELDPHKELLGEAAQMDALEKALLWAREASVNKMKMHINYLGVSPVDMSTNQTLTDDALRAAYRKKASEDPGFFIKSYDDKSIELKYFVEKAITEGKITFRENSAYWTSSNGVICDCSGIKSNTGQIQRLVEFGSLAEGEEFSAQIKALYK